MNQDKNVGVGLFGLGNIGVGVVRTLAANKDVIARNLGFSLNLRRIVDIDITTDRGVAVDPALLSTDRNDILNDTEISIVIELIGGAGIAKTLVEASLNAGKHVVTANKELIAKHGPELAALAAKNGVLLLFEASVGGGIPVLTPLLTCLRANKIDRVLGIVNGTTNYILTQMQDTGAAFGDILKSAQEQGFAEADPTNDIEGFDAAYKTVILCSTAFGKRVDVGDIHREGITRIAACDMENAARMGYTVKLLSVSRDLGDRLDARVHPALVPLSHPLAGIKGVLNAVYIEGRPIGPLMFVGRGAGPDATSSAVLGDVIALATDTISKTQADLFRDTPLMPVSECAFPFYIRMNVADRAGVLADVSAILAKHGISIHSVSQHSAAVQGVAEIIWLTHPAPEAEMQSALDAVRGLDCVQSTDAVIRVLDD